MEGETNQAVTCNLFHCDNIPDENNSRESDLGAQFKGMQSIMEGQGRAAGMGCSVPCTMKEQRVWKRAGRWSLKA